MSISQNLRRLIASAFAALALSAAPALAEPASGAATGSSADFWSAPAGAGLSQSMATGPMSLGDLTVDGAVENVHRRWRRGLYIYPRFYRRGWHGHRYRRAYGPYRYRYHGWYYRRPWWIASGYSRRYPRHAYYYDRYEVRRGGRCDYWARQCGRNWGYRNPDFYGCMRYHRCR